MDIITASEGLQLGVGYDTRFSELKAHVLSPEKQSVGSLNNSEAVRSEFSLRSVSSQEELIEALNEDQNQSLPWLLVKPPPALRWALNTRFDPTCVYVVIKADIRYPLRSFHQPVLEEAELEKMKSLSEAEFLNTYGDRYISGYAEGGLLQGIIKIHLESLDEKSNLEDTFSSELKVAGIDEAFNERLEGLMKTHKTGVTLFKTGRLDNFNAQIDEFLANLRLYHLEVKEFSWVTKMQLKDHSSLGLRTLDSRQTKRASEQEVLNKLGRLYIQNQVQISSVEFVLAHLYDHHNGQGVVFEEYEDFNEEELKAKEQVWKEAQQGLRNNINLLRGHCQRMQQSRTCQDLKKELFTMSETIPKIKTKNRALEQLNIALQKTSDNLQGQINHNNRHLQNQINHNNGHLQNQINHNNNHLQGQINQRAMVQTGSFYKDWHDSTFRPLYHRNRPSSYEAVYWIPFHWRFPGKPLVTCAVRHVDAHGHIRFNVYPKKVLEHGFEACFFSWSHSQIIGATLSWVAVFR